MTTIQYLTKIQFEVGATAQLMAEMALLGIKRPLIVTDKGIVAAGVLESVIASSGLSPETTVFDDTPENPTESAAISGAQLFKESGCDGIIALGGGSPIDLGKAISLLASHEGPLAQYAAILGGIERIKAQKPPVIAVPTTAGTGSEVGRAALITLEDGRKLGFISPHMIPNVAICDPALSLGLPRGLTAATGMDAVTHCIETYLSPRYNPVAEAIALDGLKTGYQALPKAYADGSNLEARKQMMMAALQGGLTFQKGLGAVHSLSHALGAMKSLRLHHGTLNAVLLPAVLRFNKEGLDAKYHAIADAMGVDRSTDLAEEIKRYTVALGLPARLSEMGVPRDCFASVAEAAVLDHSTATNPKPASAADFVHMLEESW